jgi:hypothetical protein
MKTIEEKSTYQQEKVYNDVVEVYSIGDESSGLGKGTSYN